MMSQQSVFQLLVQYFFTIFLLFLLFCKMANSSFLRFIRTFEFRVRMRNGLKVMELVDIFIGYKFRENNGEERYKMTYNRFEFIKKCNK